MIKKTYNIGFLAKEITNNNTDDLTTTNNEVLKGEVFIGENGEKMTGTIETFGGETEVSSITLKELLDTKKNADYLFYNFKGDTIPINYWDTENVYSMNGMFQNCNVKDIPALNMDNVEYMDNMYNGTTAETINIQQPEPRMFRMARRSLSDVEQFMQEIGKLDEWNDLVWSNIELNENVRSVNGLLNGAQNVQNVKINNNAKRIKKLYASALGNNKSLKIFWVTNCGNIEEGIKNIVKNCPNIETLVLENAKYEGVLPTLDANSRKTPIKYLYLDNLENLVLLLGTIGLENLEHFKALGCVNLESLDQAGRGIQTLKTYKVKNKHIKNISFTEFTTYKAETVPYLQYFEPGCIIYAIEPERYYIIKNNGIFERIVGNIDDYIKKNGNNAPMLKLNQSMNNRSELLQATLDCFLKGAILYSTVDNKYYKKDLVLGEWVEIDEPSKYPLKQSSFTLKDMTLAFYNSGVEHVELSDATDIGKERKTWHLGNHFWSVLAERENSIKCEGYEGNYDLPVNPNKLKYFRPGTVFHWLDTNTFYEIDDNNNAIAINPNEYLKTHDIFPPIKTKYDLKVKVNINQELMRLYNKYNYDKNNGAFVYDQHSRSFYNIFYIPVVNKSIDEIPTDDYNEGTLVIANDKKCYKKIGKQWISNDIFYSVPRKYNIAYTSRYGAKEIKPNTYLNTLFVCELNSFATTEPKTSWLEDLGEGNVLKTTKDGKLYKITGGTIEEVNDSYLNGKNVINMIMTGTYDLNIKESINFQPTVKHFEIGGTIIDSDRFGLSNDWNDSYRSLGNINSAFEKCYNLKTLILPGIGMSFDISASTVFEEEDIITIFNNLAKLKSTQRITLNSKYNNLSNEIKSIALDKGWTIVFR